jgi:chromosome partitioning protein
VARVIVVANQKGGVGKTTTAETLAASMAAAECPTLLIDLDPQANATSSLGVSPADYEADTYDVLGDAKQATRGDAASVLRSRLHPPSWSALR